MLWWLSWFGFGSASGFVSGEFGFLTWFVNCYDNVCVGCCGVSWRSNSVSVAAWNSRLRGDFGRFAFVDGGGDLDERSAPISDSALEPVHGFAGRIGRWLGSEEEGFGRVSEEVLLQLDVAPSLRVKPGLESRVFRVGRDARCCPVCWTSAVGDPKTDRSAVGES